MKKRISGILFCVAALSSSLSYADIPLANSSRFDTKAYIGLKWSLNGSYTPSLVLGVIRAKVDSDGDTQGANLSLDVNLAGNIQPGKIKINYMRGQENVQGELGFGYDFIKNAPLIGAGLNGPYINIGADLFTTDSSLVPFGIIHSQGSLDKPTAVQPPR
ncbi:hypothetical protein CXF72_09710 [Psychromonas sp. MB-3u-54]|uniref:hypothetical protein n=1 Tax=Psychromonas sp. MB-3u-54 TaxID=2058319 RepID=UPI000C3452AB|nr:hypothetical protein [Psychromonas sp. MB-3u-54]PKH02785.1 hypothetical protein CXF72_09710 [Psychromonas sp. MB-3u-54]